MYAIRHKPSLTWVRIIPRAYGDETRNMNLFEGNKGVIFVTDDKEIAEGIATGRIYRDKMNEALTRILPPTFYVVKPIYSSIYEVVELTPKEEENGQ